ncbi:MAG TPA: hypothetical protein DEG17_01040 [Cyanobacteria bacterium UBA11149]|nr:hypothetical protein [Cyanobacteria bacterium UBA11367]HBE59073.1 hypothetical protein [Cyanobacteria bacterium UBA11366]HBK66598.1 hypothetical protein [Cyanobacteria bacterium UBA11166]HBR72753.1 hypothetical protein [Cyanobacteria bacterium UBA11159]HBS67930.1 hypothetical protein [Cyanobacteria bacterium UBA11153]HBW87499.1 hypothetical protein [Cyanobacteria bacterium UBA11149]HCA94039.1 hypothetical protein [Cyanobacteria bacterium UBA9226]
MSIFNGNIRILGPRPSGKLTYLVALASFPHADDKTSPIISIDLLGDETQCLSQMGEHILRNGLGLAPTPPGSEGIYRFLIKLKSRSSIIPGFRSKDTELHFSCSFYAGELFDCLLENKNNDLVCRYLDDLASVKQVILLIDTTSRLDQHCAEVLEVLEKELSQRITATEKQDYRIAIVFSKFDQPQAWIYRENIEQFTALKFPQMKSVMENWSQSWSCRTHYFACSAYGMTGNPLVPNAACINRGETGTFAVLKSPITWNPFGLVSPIYWLLTGKHDRRLDTA